MRKIVRMQNATRRACCFDKGAVYSRLVTKSLFVKLLK